MEAEFGSLLGSSGFEVAEVLPTALVIHDTRGQRRSRGARPTAFF
jgi:hypothetical protein